MYLRQLPSGRWNVEVKRRGQKFTTTRTTKASARQWGLELEDRLDRGLTYDPRDGRRTVKAWAGEWWAARVAEPTTLASDDVRLRTHVLPRWEDEPLERITNMAVQGWVRQLEKQMSPASVAKCYYLLSSILGAAVRDRLLLANPCDGVRLPATSKGREVYLSRLQVDTICEGCKRPEDVLVIRLLAHSGLRWSELAGLRTTSLDLLRKQLHIRQVTTRCGDKDYPKSAAGRRTVPLSSALVDELAAHLVGVERGRRVFVGARGAPLSNVNFRHRVWIPAVEAAGIDPRPTLHDLRHTAASWLVQSGVPLYDVMRFLGHESITTTMRYSHLEPDQHDRVREALERTAKRTADGPYGARNPAEQRG
jgi:integrase